MATTQQNNFVKAVYPAAKQMYTNDMVNSINPLFVTAQAALESGWGASAIGNNLFGITKGSYKGKTKLVLTTEYLSTPDRKFALPEHIVSVTHLNGGRYKYKVYRLFRDYDSLEDCLKDHLSILSKPIYRDAWAFRNNPVAFARHISDNVGGRYATASDYADIMALMIRQVSIIVEHIGL